MMWRSKLSVVLITLFVLGVMGIMTAKPVYAAETVPINATKSIPIPGGEVTFNVNGDVYTSSDTYSIGGTYTVTPDGATPWSLSFSVTKTSYGYIISGGGGPPGAEAIASGGDTQTGSRGVISFGPVSFTAIHWDVGCPWHAALILKLSYDAGISGLVGNYGEVYVVWIYTFTSDGVTKTLALYVGYYDTTKIWHLYYTVSGYIIGQKSADVNGDGVLDGNDITWFTAHYRDTGVCDEPEIFDLNNDGVVNADDSQTLEYDVYGWF